MTKKTIITQAFGIIAQSKYANEVTKHADFSKFALDCGDSKIAQAFVRTGKIMDQASLTAIGLKHGSDIVWEAILRTEIKLSQEIYVDIVKNYEFRKAHDFMRFNNLLNDKELITETLGECIEDSEVSKNNTFLCFYLRSRNIDLVNDKVLLIKIAKVYKSVESIWRHLFDNIIKDFGEAFSLCEEYGNNCIWREFAQSNVTKNCKDPDKLVGLINILETDYWKGIVGDIIDQIESK